MELELDTNDPRNKQAVSDMMDEIASFIFTKSQEFLVSNKSVDTGFLLKSGGIDLTDKEVKLIHYRVPYACIIGKNQKIKTENKWEQVNGLKSKVLSKDGKYHTAFSFVTGRFFNKPFGIIIRCKKMRGNGLFVTDDHLILTYKKRNVIWVQARELKKGDIVFRPLKIAWNKGTGKKEFICQECGEMFENWERYEKIGRAKYCSQKCYHKNTYHNRAEGKRWKLTLKQRERSSGKNNPAWKGGIDKLPYGIGWNSVLKQRVKERDNYQCRECGISEDIHKGSLHVHHIDGDRLNNKMENLITLCCSCHAKKQWQDCELVDIDLDVFEPVEITEIEKVRANNYKGSSKKTKLWDIKVDGDNSFVCGGILIHNSAVEYGRDPGSMPPVSALEGWVRRKLKKRGREITSTSWAIAMSIKKNGIVARPYIRPSLQAASIKFNMRGLGVAADFG